ncbi:MAG: Panthothenate kinase related protein [Glaciihabitans sp.]|nr:Panthothenate kinase related protein [Glaciihabitans sp.]
MIASVPPPRSTAAPAVLSASTADLIELARAMAIPGERRILGITGAPGAGKSTVSTAIAEALGDAAVIVGMDGFHLANQELSRLGRADRKGASDTFDSHGYAALLERLRNTRETDTIYAPWFNRGIEESIGSAIPVSPTTPLVITEGNYLLMEDRGWGRAGAAIDEIWYIDIPGDVRLERLIRRHELHGRSHDAAEKWVAAVDQKNAVLIDATQNRADRIIHLTD